MSPYTRGLALGVTIGTLFGIAVAVVGGALLWSALTWPLA